MTANGHFENFVLMYVYIRYNNEIRKIKLIA